MNKRDEAKNATNATKKLQKEAFLKSLEGGVTIKDAAEAAGVSRVTAWRWRKSKAFLKKVLAIIDSRTQTVEDALFATALKGNVIAQIFWLKNRASDRWKDVKEVGGSLGLTYANLVKAKKEREKR